MLIYDTEELVQRAKKKYHQLKSDGNPGNSGNPDNFKILKDLSEMLFTEATVESMNILEKWLDEADEKEGETCL